MLNILESEGVRTVHFGSSAVQGAMRIDQPTNIELEYVQQMMMWLLFRDSASHIVQLGLGAAALTKFCYHRLASTTVTAVELNPGVIDIRSEEHTSELQSLMRISYAVFCLKKKI